MDQGIISNLKVHYRRLLLKERIGKLDEGKEFESTLLQALRMLKKGWASVKPETIKNCFRHAGFAKNQVRLFL